MNVRRDAPVLMLEPRAWYSWDFEVFQDGERLTMIDRVWYRERATFEVDGRAYVVRRTDLLRGEFALERDRAVLATARKLSPFRRAFEVRIGAARYDLRAVSALRREFRLFQGGVPVGAVTPLSIFRRRAAAQLPPEIPLPARLFLIFLVLVLWKRQSDAASSSGS